MQIPFTSFNFSALAKDIDSFFRTQCSGEFPPDCGPELVTSAPKLVPAVMFLPSFLSGSLSPSVAGAAPVEPGPVGRADRDRGRRERFRAGCEDGAH